MGELVRHCRTDFPRCSRESDGRKHVNLVTEWKSYKQNLARLEEARSYLLAMEEILRIRQWLKNIPLSKLVVGDLELVQNYLQQTVTDEKRVKAFKTYATTFPGFIRCEHCWSDINGAANHYCYHITGNDCDCKKCSEAK